MKKKIEIGLGFGNDKKKCAKALQIAVGFPGVTKASLDESKITVESEGVDSVELIKKLRKKMKYAQLISEGQVEEKKKEEKKEEKKKEDPPPLYWPPHYPCPPMPYYEPIVEYQQTSPCTIM